MDNAKIYNLLSGLVDDELSPEKKFKALEHIKNEEWCRHEYDEMKQLKKMLPTSLPAYELSSDFDLNLKHKLIEEENKETWFSRMVDSGIFGKLSYGMATASILFMGFLGMKFYNANAGQLEAAEITQPISQPVITKNNLETTTITTQEPTNALRQTPIKEVIQTQPPITRAYKAPQPTKQLTAKTNFNHPPISEEFNHQTEAILTINRGKNSISFDLKTGEPFTENDAKQLPKFKDMLSKSKIDLAVVQKHLSNKKKMSNDLKDK